MSSEQRAEAVEKQTSRLESFSDGVFAVAITLLVFNLQVPHLPAGAISVPALGSALFQQWPSYLTFITSFATVLIMWASHHGIFKPSGQRCRLSGSGPALFEGSQQGLALVTKTKAGELLPLSAGALAS